MQYTLTPDLETGNAQIDREHKELFARVNRLMEACSAGRGRTEAGPAMEFLRSYVATHFRHEEALQQDSKYPNYVPHKKFHDEYEKKLRDIANSLVGSEVTIAGLGQINQHISTLIMHIRLEDKKLGQYLKQK